MRLAGAQWILLLLLHVTLVVRGRGSSTDRGLENDACYKGLTCLNNSEALLGCPHGDVECGKNSSCVLYESGLYVPGCVPNSTDLTPGARICPEALLHGGSFTGRLGMWNSSGPCALKYFTPAAAFALLQNKTVSFSGDSLMREVFLRLVAHLRGFAVNGDRTFHSDAAFSRNATHDFLSVELLGSPLARAPVPNPLLRITFEWGPDHTASDGGLRVAAEEVLAWAPDVAVVGSIYWHESIAIAEHELDATRALAERVRRVFWVGTPDNGKRNGSEEDRAFNAGVPLRNAAMRRWCGEHGVAFVPFDRLEEGARGLSNARMNGVHFMCAYTSGAIHGQGHFRFFPLVDLGPDPNGPDNCRDVVNDALVQMILNGL